MRVPLPLPTTIATWTVATFFPAAAAAQSGGPLLALPHSFSIDPTTTLSGSGPDSLVFSDTGIDGVLPPPPDPSAAPDFSTFPGTIGLNIDALSIGVDWVVSTPTGLAVVPTPQWAAISTSVTPATVGIPGSVVAAEVAAADGAAADVFGYVIPGSTFPPALVGVPFRSLDSTEMATFGGGGLPNINAHDIYLSLLYLENPQLGALLGPPTVFFSITAADAAGIPASWTTVPGLRSGATVFSSTWVPGSMSWTPVTVAFAPSAFGLSSSEDLDALALDLVRGLVLFSTDSLLPPPGGPPRDPILFSVLGSGINTAYKLPTGTPIKTEIGLGLGLDDVDGICALDPGSALAPSSINLPFMLGTVQQPLPSGLPTTLQASAWRTFDSLIGEEFAETWMTGWPPPGTPQPGLAVSAASLTSSFGPFIVLDVFVRPSPTNLFEGHPHRTELNIPPSIVFTGQELFLLWGALSPTSFDVSHPIGITL